jgi:hypothetical protein
MVTFVPRELGDFREKTKADDPDAIVDTGTHIARQIAPGAATRRQLDRWKLAVMVHHLAGPRRLSTKHRKWIVDFLSRSDPMFAGYLAAAPRDELLRWCRGALKNLAEDETVAIAFRTSPVEADRPPDDGRDHHFRSRAHSPRQARSDDRTASKQRQRPWREGRRSAPKARSRLQRKICVFQRPGKLKLFL